MTRSKRASKLLSLCLITALLWGAVCGYKAFLGPGLTDAAAAAIDLGTLTPTDIVPIEPPAELMATTVPQVKNVLVTVTVTRSDLNHANSTIRFRDDRASFDLDLHKYDLGDLPNISSTVWIDWEDNREMGIYVLSSHNFAANTTILRACFNAPSTATITHASLFEGSSPLIQCITSGALSDANTNADNALAYQVAFLGDVDMNGTIDAVDNLKTLQFAAGTITLTADQQLAADVTLDGSVDAVDAMKISQYSVQTLASFWDHGRFNIPAANVEGVGDNNVFRLKNVSDSKYLTTADIRSLPVYLSTTYNPKQTIAKFKFERVSGAGYYRIRHMASGALLRLDNNYKTTLSTTDVKDESHYWYVVPVAGGFQIVNKTDTGLALTNAFPTDYQTTNCCADYFDRGNVWKLEGPKVTIYYHYDYAYKARSSQINEYTDEQIRSTISSILFDRFGLTVTSIVVNDTFLSWGDQCYNNPSNITISQANSACSCSGTSPNICKTYSGGTLDIGEHHKNYQAQLQYTYNMLRDPAGVDIHILFSGHVPCGGRNGNHAIDPVSGIASSGTEDNTGYRIANVFYIGQESDYRRSLTALHELSHILGAAGGVVDQEHANNVCIMSAGISRENDDLLEFWEYEEYDNLFCSSCETKIKNYMKYF